MSDDTTEDEQATNSPDTDGEQTNSVTELAHRINEDPRFDNEKFNRASAEQAQQLVEANREKIKEIAAVTNPLIRAAAEASRNVLFRGINEFRRLHEDMAPTWGAHGLLDETGYVPDGVERLSVRGSIATEIFERARELWESTPEDEHTSAVDQLREFIAEHLSTPEGRCWRVFRLIRNLACYDEPEGVFYNYADKALASSGADDAPDEHRDKLARYLFESAQHLGHRVQESIDKLPDDFEGPITWPEDGMLWLDAVAIDWLEAEGWDGWNSDPEGARKSARERWNSHTGGRQLLALWTNPDTNIPVMLQPVEWVCEYLVKHPEQLREPEPATMSGIHHAGDRYGKLEKTAAAVTPRGQLDEQSQRAVDIDDAGSVTVDNERYSNAPGVLRVMPHTMGVTPTHQSANPHEIQLPLALHLDDGAPLPLTVYTDTQAILKPKAAKLAVALHLLAPEDGALATVELGRLTEWVNQGRSRPGQKRNREQVQSDLYAVRSLGIPGDLPGEGVNLSHNVQMFQVAVPENPSKSAEVVFGRTRMFQRLIRSLGAKGGPLRKLRGNILINADGFMRISGNDSDAARMYLALCAFWNDRNWNPDNIQWLDVDKLGHLANTLTLPARRYLQGKGGDRRRISEGRNDTEKTVDKLIDKYELAGDVDAKGRGGNRQLLIRPTDEHREAWKRLRAGRDEILGL